MRAGLTGPAKACIFSHCLVAMILNSWSLLASALRTFTPRGGFAPFYPILGKDPGALNCSTHYYRQQVDHFRFDASPRYFQQRYLTYDKYWEGGKGNPIMFYTGNEADVELYANATGFIWNYARDRGAMIVFAEHRYYGKSEPFGIDSWKVDPTFLTAEQALADFATLLWHLKRMWRAADSPVIAVGGSYGGMLAAMMRRRYPHLITGALAASAPLNAFIGIPGFNPQAFWQVVTRDATAAAGAAPRCADNVRAAFAALLSAGRDKGGRRRLQAAMRLCAPLKGEKDVEALAYWAQGAYDAYAMGNYPYPSSYMTGDVLKPLPAWPMREACRPLAEVLEGEAELLEGLRASVAVLYNITGDLECFDLQTEGPAAGDQGPWDYQWCTELLPQELPYFPADGTSDMFWDQGPFDLAAVTAHCQTTWGVRPRPTWFADQFGDDGWRSTPNILFSNGEYDPWTAFGVLESPGPGVHAVVIPQGAHHLDLMFPHPDDPPGLRAVREWEMGVLDGWVAEARARKGDMLS